MSAFPRQAVSLDTSPLLRETLWLYFEQAKKERKAHGFHVPKIDPILHAFTEPMNVGAEYDSDGKRLGKNLFVEVDAGFILGNAPYLLFTSTLEMRASGIIEFASRLHDPHDRSFTGLHRKAEDFLVRNPSLCGSGRHAANHFVEGYLGYLKEGAYTADINEITQKALQNLKEGLSAKANERYLNAIRHESQHWGFGDCALSKDVRRIMGRHQPLEGYYMKDAIASLLARTPRQATWEEFHDAALIYTLNEAGGYAFSVTPKNSWSHAKGQPLMEQIVLRLCTAQNPSSIPFQGMLQMQNDAAFSYAAAITQTPSRLGRAIEEADTIADYVSILKTGSPAAPSAAKEAHQWRSAALRAASRDAGRIS